MPLGAFIVIQGNKRKNHCISERINCPAAGKQKGKAGWGRAHRLGLGWGGQDLGMGTPSLRPAEVAGSGLQTYLKVVWLDLTGSILDPRNVTSKHLETTQEVTRGKQVDTRVPSVS